MADHKNLKTASKVIHAGQSPEAITGAVMQPVFQTSTYAQKWPAKHTGYEYSRSQNPTREAMERCIALLEDGNHGIAFGSGSAATNAVLQSMPANAKIVSGDDVYGGTYRLFTKLYAKHGFEFSFVDLTSIDPVEAIPEGTDLVWLESPTNPLLKISDIAALAARAHEVGALVAVDNTFATPIFQKPLNLGADFVVHSTTKYLNGHSDVVGGIVVTASDELAESIRFVQNSAGAVPGPWDTWLTLRGLKTLDVRMQRHQANAEKIITWLVENPNVGRVYYPMLDSHPNSDIAKKQMSGFGGMISFVLNANLYQAEKFCASTKLFTLAESLGGVESLLEIPASMTHASIPKEIREKAGIDDGLIRISVGIEDVDDLIADLDQALKIALS